MVNDQNTFINNLLSLEEIQKIDRTGLSIHDRHSLRLFWHCLSCFKEMAKGISSGPLPSESVRLNWFLSQPFFLTENEKEFVDVLLKQFEFAALQLEEWADQLDITPLELTLEDLINSIMQKRKLD